MKRGRWWLGGKRDEGGDGEGGDLYSCQEGKTNMVSVLGRGRVTIGLLSSQHRRVDYPLCPQDLCGLHELVWNYVSIRKPRC